MAAESGSRVRPLKLVVFGATGDTGKEVVKQGLEKGHHITAIVRSPEKVITRNENLELVKGDACDLESFAAVLEGKDGVISCLGVFSSIFNITTFYSESTNAILEGMKRYGVTRLVTMTSWCIQPGPNNSWVVDWIINPLFLNGVAKDAVRMEKLIEGTDPRVLNYTIVRPGILLNGERTGKYKVEYGQCSIDTKWTVVRADVAELMLKCMESDEYDRQGVAIGGL